MTSPLADAAALLRQAGPGDPAVRAALERIAPPDVRREPDLTVEVATTLATAGEATRADELLGWLGAGEPAPGIENLRALLWAAAGDTTRAEAIWGAALTSPG